MATDRAKGRRPAEKKTDQETERSKVLSSGRFPTRKYLRNKEMSYAQFAGCDLSGSDLFGTKFGHASFRGCRLVGVNFTATNLSFADFEGADLTDAVLEDANVRGARFVRVAGLSERVLERLEKHGAIVSDGNEQPEARNLPTAS